MNTSIVLVAVVWYAIGQGIRDGDERFGTVTARRPVLEAALAARVRVRRGVRVTGVRTDGRTPVPRITGVTTSDGDIDGLPAVGFKLGRWVDSVMMQRPLGPGRTTLPDDKPPA